MTIPDTCLDEFQSSLGEGGEDADDEDNIAYGNVVQAIADVQGSTPKHEIFTYSVKNAGQLVSLRALKWENVLLIHVNYLCLGHMSKECFVSLLSYADETLHCVKAFLFFDRLAPDKQRKQIIHDFMYLGFEPLAPGHPSLPVQTDKYQFMAYELECCDD